jgi:DNA-binding NtrC family response regulator
MPEPGTPQLEFDDWPTLDTLKNRYIVIMLERHGGHKLRAAAALGISLKTLYTRLNRMELGNNRPSSSPRGA